jgi:hypothetical protein
MRVWLKLVFFQLILPKRGILMVICLLFNLNTFEKNLKDFDGKDFPTIKRVSLNQKIIDFQYFGFNYETKKN